MDDIPVYLEIGSRRVFAGAIEWPGWCRSGRDEDAALQALATYAPRYASAIGRSPRGFTADVRVVERLKGNATTDFGAPGIAPSLDARNVTDAELPKLSRILRSCWEAFDAAAKRASGAELVKGPRGGGRDVEKMIDHVREAETAYLSVLGGKIAKELSNDMQAVRAEFLDALAARARGEPVTKRRPSAKTWSPRYAVRRSAWHALDHAWEIEDRMPG